MTMSLPLIDVFDNPLMIETKKPRPGVLFSVKGKVQEADKKNGNGRVYPLSLFEKHFKAGSDFMKNVKARRVISELDHPSEQEQKDHGALSLRRGAAVLSDVWLEGKNVMGRFEILDNPYGKMLDTYYKAGVPVGSSSRCDGSTEYDDKLKAEKVKTEGFKPVTFDFVAQPSVYDANPLPEAIKRQRTTQLIECVVDLAKEDGWCPEYEEYLESMGVRSPRSLGLTENVLEKPFEDKESEMELKEMQRMIDKLQEQLYTEVKDKSVIESELGNIKAEFAEMRAQLEKITEERDNLKQHFEELDEGSLVEKVTQLEEALKEKTELLEGAAKAIRSGESIVECFTEEIAERVEEFNELQIRYNVAEQLIQYFLDKKEELEKAEVVSDKLESVPEDTRDRIGTLLMKCESEEEMDEHLEAFLGESLQQGDEEEEGGEHSPDSQEPLVPSQMPENLRGKESNQPLSEGLQLMRLMKARMSN